MSAFTVASQQQTPDTDETQVALLSAGSLGELVGEQTCRDHSDEDESNLVVFLAVAPDVKVRDLGLGSQVIKDDLFPGDLRIEPHGLVDIPECFHGVVLSAELLVDPIQALCPLFSPCLMRGL